MVQEDSNRPPTTDQLRHQIDRGATGDKVDFPDPAAAPLGTDAEAGGAPPTAVEQDMAYRAEVWHRPDRQFPIRALVLGMAVVVVLAVLVGVAVLFS